LEARNHLRGKISTINEEKLQNSLIVLDRIPKSKRKTGWGPPSRPKTLMEKAREKVRSSSIPSWSSAPSKVFATNSIPRPSTKLTPMASSSNVVHRPGHICLMTKSKPTTSTKPTYTSTSNSNPISYYDLIIGKNQPSRSIDDSLRDPTVVNPIKRELPTDFETSSQSIKKPCTNQVEEVNDVKDSIPNPRTTTPRIKVSTKTIRKAPMRSVSPTKVSRPSLPSAPPPSKRSLPRKHVIRPVVGGIFMPKSRPSH